MDAIRSNHMDEDYDSDLGKSRGHGVAQASGLSSEKKAEEIESPSIGPVDKTKHDIKIIVLVVLLLITSAAIYFFLMFRSSIKNYPSLQPNGFSTQSQVTKSSGLSWQDRILYTATTFETQIPSDVHSVNTDGTNDKPHSFICDGEVIAPIGNVARSPDGKTLVFALPLKEERQKDSNWKNELLNGTKKFTQGILYIYNLTDDSCTSTQLLVDNLYSQNIAFSPDGKQIAYVFYGLHIYELETKKDTALTAQEGSARVPQIILGPLIWNQSGSAIYMPVAKDLTQDITQVNLVRVNISQSTSETVMRLPNYYSAEAQKHFFPAGAPFPTKIPDNPSTFSVSPDENSVIVEENGNLVIKSIANPSSQQIIVYNKRDYAPHEPYGHAEKVVWLPTGWILMSFGQTSGGSSAGFMLASLNGAKAIRVPGHYFSANVTGDKFVYNFQYFGIYYVPPGEPVPSGFRKGIDDTGHRYDGIGIYDLNLGKDNELSGQNKPAGIIGTWFW